MSEEKSMPEQLAPIPADDKQDRAAFAAQAGTLLGELLGLAAPTGDVIDKRQTLLAKLADELFPQCGFVFFVFDPSGEGDTGHTHAISNMDPEPMIDLLSQFVQSATDAEESKAKEAGLAG